MTTRAGDIDTPEFRPRPPLAPCRPDGSQPRGNGGRARNGERSPALVATVANAPTPASPQASAAHPASELAYLAATEALAHSSGRRTLPRRSAGSADRPD